MARSLEQRIADLERTITEFFTGRSNKSSARKTGKAKKSAGRSAKKAKTSRKTSKRKSAR